MSLVKLTNLGDEQFVATFNNIKYTIDKDGFLIIDERTANHWLGDHNITDEDAKDVEKNRLRLLWGENLSKWKIKVEGIITEAKVEDKVIEPKKTMLLDNVISEVPVEPEFEDLEKVTKKRGK